MNTHEIQMCVMDCLLDDEVESLTLLMEALNDEDQMSWRTARGQMFSVTEIQIALRTLTATGYVTPCAEKPPAFRLQPIPYDEVGVNVPWESVWFHLEPKGREAFTRWWKEDGQHKYL
ncbi:MAG: hypothetical protein FWD61_20510 [Phycisphaerales bacterium]|nr:hypothetical protein [Phycisphaerales bacterium]